MRSMTWLLVLVLVAGWMGVSYAQSPTVRAYFDTGFTAMSKDCPPGGGVDTMYVVARDFGFMLTGVEYAINYPASMTWIADLSIPPVTIGTTPTGISEGWAVPQDGFGGFLVAKVLFTWNCSGCVLTNDPVVVSPHPQTGFVRATRWPDYQFVNAVGMRSLVCSTVPVEETTWGKMKSLYAQP